MAKRRNSLRDVITVIRNINYLKSPNGEILELAEISKSYRVNVNTRSADAIDRVYDYPEIKYDLSIRMRSEAYNEAFVGDSVRVIYKGASYEYTDSAEESDRIRVVFLTRTE